jgi:hypothetical protein
MTRNIIIVFSCAQSIANCPKTFPIFSPPALRIYPRSRSEIAHENPENACKLPFLVTQAPNRSYAILPPSNLQDFYNIPRGENSARTCKNHLPRAKDKTVKLITKARKYRNHEKESSPFVLYPFRVFVTKIPLPPAKNQISQSKPRRSPAGMASPGLQSAGNIFAGEFNPSVPGLPAR